MKGRLSVGGYVNYSVFNSLTIMIIIDIDINYISLV